MNLLYEGPADPGIHALIVGVSEYSNLPEGNISAPPALLGLRRLESPALAAYRIADWLVRRREHLALPLASCRLLVAPSQKEIDAEPRLGELVADCTFKTFRAAARAWRTAASSHSENITIFYFAGHGTQRTRPSHVMLMQDFGEDLDLIYGHAADTDELIAGLLPRGDRPGMALTQLYFIDACRVRPRYARGYDKARSGALWDEQHSDFDERSTSIFYSTAPGREALAQKGKQTLFSEALLQCLEGMAGTNDVGDASDALRWRVSVHSLHKALGRRLEHLASLEKRVQRYTNAQLAAADTTLHFLDGPPIIDVSIAVEPAEAFICANLSIFDNQATPVRAIAAPIAPYPFRAQMPAGLYSVRARIDPPEPRFANRERLFQVAPATPAIILPVT